MVRQVRQLRAAAQLARHQRRESHLLDKTRICKFFAKGQCARGEACTFAHGTEQLHAQPDLYRTELCFDFARSGTCRAGDDCKFAHTAEQLRLVTVPEADGTCGMPEGAADPRRVQRQMEAFKLQEETQALQNAADTGGRGRKQAKVRELRRYHSPTSTAADDEDAENPFAAFTRNNSLTSDDWEALHGEEESVSSSARKMTGCGSPPKGGMNRNMSLSSDDWEASSASVKTDTGSASPSGSSPSTRGSSASDQAIFTLVVRNTFFEVQSYAQGNASRRARSTPAACN